MVLIKHHNFEEAALLENSMIIDVNAKKSVLGNKHLNFAYHPCISSLHLDFCLSHFFA